MPPLRFSRDKLISWEQTDRVHQQARRVLAEIGLQVSQDEIASRLRSAGFRVAGSRVLFEPRVVDEYVDEMRCGLASRSRSTAAAAQDGADNGKLALGVSSYSLHVHDIETDQIVPYTTGRLVNMCKLIDSLAGEGVHGVPPGIPTEESPDLQPVAQYRIAAHYARQGATPVDPTSARTVRYLLDMAEVMGKPIRSLPVYLPSPLRIGGESLEVVLASIDRLDEVRVSSMPATGATAPLHPFGALVLAAAEVMGGSIAVRAVTGKPTCFAVDIFPFDLRAGAMVFGSPENLLFQMLCRDLNHYYGWAWDPAPNNIYVMSKLPDAQAASDKAAIMAVGAFLGARRFGAAGTLSLDDIFSPVQLLVDCEIRNWVQRAIRGVWMGEEAVADWLHEIKTGIDQSFIALDSTLDHYRRHVWYPQRFERRAIGPWLAEGQPGLSARLKQEIRRRIAGHDYELDRDRSKEIERIYRQARAAVQA